MAPNQRPGVGWLHGAIPLLFLQKIILYSCYFLSPKYFLLVSIKPIRIGIYPEQKRKLHLLRCSLDYLLFLAQSHQNLRFW